MSLTKRYIDIDFGNDARPLKRVTGTIVQGNNKVNILRINYPGIDKNHSVVALSKRADEVTGSTLLNYSSESNRFELVLHNWFTAVSGELQITFAVYSQTPEINEEGIIITETDTLKKVYLNVEESISADLPAPEDESIFIDIAVMVDSFDTRLTTLEETVDPLTIKVIYNESTGYDSFLTEGIYKCILKFNNTVALDICHLFVMKSGNNIKQIRTAKKGYYERTYDTATATFSNWIFNQYNVDGITPYNSSTTYSKGAIVAKDGELYVAIASVPANTDFTNSGYWNTLSNYFFTQIQDTVIIKLTINQTCPDIRKDIAHYLLTNNLFEKYYLINEQFLCIARNSYSTTYRVEINDLKYASISVINQIDITNIPAVNDLVFSSRSFISDIGGTINGNLSVYGTFDNMSSSSSGYGTLRNSPGEIFIRAAAPNYAYESSITTTPSEIKVDAEKVTHNGNKIATVKEIEYLNKKIKNLEASAEGKTFIYELDDSVAYKKDIPKKASPYAVINKIGGMSYVSENLFNPNGEVISSNYGTTIEELEDGTGVRAILGKAPTIGSTPKQFASATIFIPLEKFDLTKSYRFIIGSTYSSVANGNNHRVSMNWINEKYEVLKQIIELNGKYDGATSMNNYRNLTGNNYPPDGTIGMGIIIYANNQSEEAVVGSYIEYRDFFIGINNTNEFKPYFEGIRNSAVTSITSHSANLFNLPNVVRSELGYTMRCLNGEIYFSGTSTSIGDIIFNLEKPLPAGTYSLSMFNNLLNNLSGVSFGFIINGIINGKSFSQENSTLTITTESDISQIVIVVSNTNIDLTNFTLYPMIVKGSVPANEFKNYWSTKKELPKELLNLTNIDLGVNENYYNYIDLINKKFIINVIPFKAHGDKYIELISKNEELGFYKFRVTIITDETLKASNTINGNLVQNSGFPNYTKWQDYANNSYEQVALQNYHIMVVISKSKASTVEEFRTWLANNPISGVYALNVPIEEDISDLLKDFDEFIEVEELGDLTFENEKKNAVPSTITYQVKVV